MPPADRPPPLDADHAARLQAAFDAVLELAVDARAAWIDTRVGDAGDRAALQRLLEADARDGPLEQPAAELIESIGTDEARLAQGMVGRRIGAFRQQRLLGEGGMAIVYLG